MYSKLKISVIKVISIITLITCLILCGSLIILTISKSRIEIAEKNTEELIKSYTSTEDTSSTNTWDISAAENDNVIATLSDNGTLTISGTGNMKDWEWNPKTEWHGMSDKVTTVVIETGVTNIGSKAFYGCTSLTNIEISESVTRLGYYAFDICINLTSINVNENNLNYKTENGVLYTKDGLEIIKYPQGKNEKKYTILGEVTTIGNSAFEDCGNLMSIEIPESVTSIGDFAFEDCGNLMSIEIPGSVTSIGGSAFHNCNNLTNIRISEGVTSIGNKAFEGCTSLKTIEIPKSVKNIGYKIVANCTSLTSINVNEDNTNYKDDNGVLYTKDGLIIIQYPEGKEDTEYTILEGVTTIYPYAFDNCKYLITVKIPRSVTVIGMYEFSYCESLTSIDVNELNKSYKDDNGVLYTKDGTEIIRYPKGRLETEYTILSGVRKISEEAFYNCNKLTSIEIPESVTSIEKRAFAGCASLTNIEIPEGVTSIEEQAFSRCSNLTSIGIPEGVTSIENRAFENCTNLTSINFPESVTSIGYSIFDYSKVTKIVNANINIELPNILLRVQNENDILYSKEGLTRTNCTIENGSIKISDINSQAKLEINDGPFKNLTYIYLNNTWNISATENDNVIATFSYDDGTLTVSGTGDMKDWKSNDKTKWNSIKDKIKKVVIENGVTNTGEYAFSNCYNITSIEIPETVTNIASSAFEYCANLISIKIDEKNTNYKDENGVLYTKDGTTIIKYPQGRLEADYTVLDGVIRIGEGAFTNSQNLIRIEIPEGVTNIECSAFYGCTGLTSIEIPQGITRIEESTFYDCYGLKYVKIPESVTSIGDYAFSGCTDLTTLEIPETVTNIGNYAFEYSIVTRFIEPNTNIKIPDILKRIQDPSDILYSENGLEIINCTIEGDEIKITDINSPAILEVIDGNLACFAYIISYNTWDISATEKDNVIATWSEDGVLTISGTGSMKNWGEESYPGWGFMTHRIKKIEMEKGITNIGDYAFEWCSILTSIEIPETVISIGKGAFDWCNNLTIICNKGTPAETYVKENNKIYIIMSEIKLKTTIEEMRINIESNIEYKIVNKNNEETLMTAYTGTGYKIKVNGNDVHTIIVTGDCTGDGKSDIQDIFAINKHRLNNGKLADEYLLAGDANRDGKTNINDIFKINKYRLGMITEF